MAAKPLSHTFEVTIGEQKIGALPKEAVNVMPMQTVAVDFMADNPGDSLLHCHMQLHMDYGFMQLIRYAHFAGHILLNDGRQIK